MCVLEGHENQVASTRYGCERSGANATCPLALEAPTGGGPPTSTQALLWPVSNLMSGQVGGASSGPEAWKVAAAGAWPLGKAPVTLGC